MKKSKFPALESAKEFLESLIESGQYAPGKRLPSIARLAAQAGVSKPTMWKAVGALKESGLIEGGFGQCIRAASPDGEQACTAPAAGQKWQRLAADIKHDILQGRFRPGESLPSVKELCAAYAASYQTLKKALSTLCDERLLRSSGKSYSVPSRAPRPSSSVIAVPFVVSAQGPPAINIDILRPLELACSRANIRLRYLLWNENLKGEGVLSDYPANTPADLSKEEQLLGICAAMHFYDERWERLLRNISHFDVPVALLDIVGNWHLPDPLKRKRPVRVFSAAVGNYPAREIARYLLAKGHTSIAYISALHDSHWSRQREKAIAEECASAGQHIGFRSFKAGRAEVALDLLPDAISRHPLSPISDFIADSSAGMQKRYAEVLNRQFSKQQLEFAWSQAELSTRLDKLFEQALADSSITAWVCANDTAGLSALSFLRDKHIDVPEKIAVAAFDNSPEALRQGLTSYDFNNETAVNAMLDFILGRAASTSRKRAFIEGTIVERQSSRISR